MAPQPSPRGSSIDPLLRASAEEPQLNIQQKIAKKNRDKERKLLAGGTFSLSNQQSMQNETSQAKFLPYENHKLFNAQKSAKIL